MYRKACFNLSSESELLEKGFTVFPLLGPDEVEAIMSFYEQNKPIDFQGNSPFHSTHFFRDRVYKREVDAYLKRIFKPPLSRHLQGYDVKFCNFMVKEPGTGSIMPLHTDWTYVDESKFRSLALWMPLTDTTNDNGALGVVAGSHHLPFDIRGPKIPHAFHRFNERIIEQFGELIPMKAGEAIVYDHRLMHYSPPNLSAVARVAINVILTPEEAPIYHYCRHGAEDFIHEYAVEDEDFYVCYDAFDIPEKATHVRRLPMVISEFSWDMIGEVARKRARNTFLETLLQKTRKLIRSGH
jgi:hypothetical protein